MTLNTTDSKIAYAGDGSTTAFAIPFKFLADGDIEALLRDDATGAESGWTANTEYTLTGAGNDSGGTLIVATSPTDYTPPSGKTLVIRRSTAEVQGAAFPAGGAFPSATVETALDRLTMLVQQHSEAIGRALSVPATDPVGATGPLPSSVERAAQFLAFDADGKPVAAAAPEGGNVVSAFMATVLDDGDAATARTTLGLAIGTDVLAPDGDGSSLTGILTGERGCGADMTLNLATNLVVEYVTAATVDIDADELVLFDSSGVGKRFASVNLTADITESGANGLDAGSEASGTWYTIWAIGKSDGTVAALLSTSSTSPTLPSGYTFQGRLGAIYNDGSSDLVAMLQNGRFVNGAGGTALANGTATSMTSVDLSGYVPPIAKSVTVLLTLSTSTGTANVSGVVAADSGATFGAAANPLFPSLSTSAFQTGPYYVEMATAQTVYYKVTGANAQMSITIRGWRY